MVIYLEVMLGINFAVNLALLWMSGRALGLRLRHWRLFAGACLGAVYALACLLTSSRMLAGPPGKLLCAGLMLVVAYAPQSSRSWLRLAGVFGLAAAATAGFTLAWTLGAGHPALSGNAMILGRHSVKVLPLGLGLAVAVSATAGRALIATTRTRSQCCSSTIHVGVRHVTLRVLVDTGNQLIDPISGMPVLVVEYAAVERFVPQSWQSMILHGLGAADPLRLLETDGDEWAGRLRVVPYRPMGSAGGTLIGFKPDWVSLARLGGRPETVHTVHDVVIAMSPRPLSLQGGFQGILPADLAG